MCSAHIVASQTITGGTLPSTVKHSLRTRNAGRICHLQKCAHPAASLCIGQPGSPTRSLNSATEEDLLQWEPIIVASPGMLPRSTLLGGEHPPQERKECSNGNILHRPPILRIGRVTARFRSKQQQDSGASPLLGLLTSQFTKGAQPVPPKAQ